MCCVALLPAEPVASLRLSQVPVQYLPHHLLRGERRRMEEALQALCCSETLPSCKAAARISSQIPTMRNVINQC